MLLVLDDLGYTADTVLKRQRGDRSAQASFLRYRSDGLPNAGDGRL